ncbi:MAG TPA: ankyrin repeat domain-containing protein [Ktedonobacterales bacterium]
MDTTRAFFQAVQSGDVTQINSLLAAQPDLLSASQRGASAVLTAVYHGQQESLKALLAHQPTLTIFEAAAVGDTQRAKELLEQDVSLANAFAPDGFTPLGLAAFFGQKAVVDLLLARGAEVNVASNNPMKVMPLHSSVAHQHLEISRALLEHGARVNVAQADEFTPLQEAAHNGQVEMIRLLLEYGADASAKNAEGKTALMMAQEAGKEEAAKMLRV